MPDASQLPALIRLYDDASETVRHTVLDTLASYGEGLEGALTGLPAAPEPEVIASVLQALARHLEPQPPAPSEGLADNAVDVPPHELAGTLDPRLADTRRDEPPRAPQPGARTRRVVRYEEGQLVRHRRYGYRGVVVAQDNGCHASDEWYEANRTRPTRDQPWYHVLVDGASHVTYAAQSSLIPDESMRAVEHPLVPFFFRDFADGRYRRNERAWPTLES